QCTAQAHRARLRKAAPEIDHVPDARQPAAGVGIEHHAVEAETQTDGNDLGEAEEAHGAMPDGERADFSRKAGARKDRDRLCAAASVRRAAIIARLDSMPSAMSANPKVHLADLLRTALRSVAPDHADISILLERPKQAGHGDFAANLAL